MRERSSTLGSLPILILFPHSRCNCRCVMCDIWKVTDAEEISVEELERHADDIKDLGVQWVVFSGGEPLMHSDLFRLTEILRRTGIRTSLLTTGLLLEQHAEQIVNGIDDVIVSLDGPPQVHDRIRRIPNAFGLLRQGVEALQSKRDDYPVMGRCTVQRENHTHLSETIDTARELGLQSISFLAADMTSQAFNRPGGWPEQRRDAVGLTAPEAESLNAEVEALIRDYKQSIEEGFVRESPAKLRRIVTSFRTQLGMAEPVAPRCNAPWTSAVIETDGALRPCFFHEPIGNVREQGLRRALNSPEAIAFRNGLDVATNPTCQRCTCSLYWQG
jgi:MoaA/NifB/PqqE/SkfB family radical SAM enzyme